MANQLMNLLSEKTSESRIKTIDSVYRGKGGEASNFNAQWRGYTLNNKPTVRVDGKDFNVGSLGSVSIPSGRGVTLRVGPSLLKADW